jgi:hypothetical protein
MQGVSAMLNVKREQTHPVAQRSNELPYDVVALASVEHPFGTMKGPHGADALPHQNADRPGPWHGRRRTGPLTPP